MPGGVRCDNGELFATVAWKETLLTALPADTGWSTPVVAAATALGTRDLSLYTAMQRATAAAAIAPTTVARALGLAVDRIIATLSE
jgi:hypothetical protein